MSYGRTYMGKRNISTKKRKNIIFNHFIKRCWERFSLCIQCSDVENIIKQIQNGNSSPCGKQSNSRKFHIVKLQGIDIVVVYNKEREIVHTCFPPTWLHKTKALQV